MFRRIHFLRKGNGRNRKGNWKCLNATLTNLSISSQLITLCLIWESSSPPSPSPPQRSFVRELRVNLKSNSNILKRLYPSEDKSRSRHSRYLSDELIIKLVIPESLEQSIQTDCLPQLEPDIRAGNEHSLREVWSFIITLVGALKSIWLWFQREVELSWVGREGLLHETSNFEKVRLQLYLAAWASDQLWRAPRS